MRQVKMVKYEIVKNRVPLTKMAGLSDSFRRACLSLCDDNYSMVFMGKYRNGRPVKGPHKHAYYLPVDEDEDGYIDHIFVYANAGFNMREQNILASIDKVWGKWGSVYIKPMYMAYEILSDSNIFGKHRKWISKTAYLLSRHPKVKGGGEWRYKDIGFDILLNCSKMCKYKYGIAYDGSKVLKDGPTDQLIRSLTHHSLPLPERITISSDSVCSFQDMEWYNRGLIVGDKYGFEVEFKYEVRGPLCLGHLAHFGFGLFEGVD